jgi:hypothetical protein
VTLAAAVVTVTVITATIVIAVLAFMAITLVAFLGEPLRGRLLAVVVTMADRNQDAAGER